MEDTERVMKRWNTIIFITFMALLFGAIFIQEHNTSSLINECPRYTIGYATTIRGKQVDYKYSIMGREFEGTWHQNPRSMKDYARGDFAAKNFYGKRFLLKVNCKEPEVNMIDWTHSIPSWVNNPPEDGWTVLPSDFPKTEFAD